MTDEELYRLTASLYDRDLVALEDLDGRGFGGWHVWTKTLDGITAMSCSEDNARLYAAAPTLLSALAEARAEVERLREALAFYAKPGRYVAPFTGGQGDLYFDCGAKARAALEGSK